MWLLSVFVSKAFPGWVSAKKAESALEILILHQGTTCTFWRMPLRWWNSTYSCRSSVFHSRTFQRHVYSQTHKSREWVSGFSSHTSKPPQFKHFINRRHHRHHVNISEADCWFCLLSVRQELPAAGSQSKFCKRLVLSHSLACSFSLSYCVVERRRRKESGLQKLWRVSTLQACCEIFSIRSTLRLPSCGICEKSCLHKK